MSEGNSQSFPGTDAAEHPQRKKKTPNSFYFKTSI